MTTPKKRSKNPAVLLKFFSSSFWHRKAEEKRSIAVLVISTQALLAVALFGGAIVFVLQFTPQFPSKQHSKIEVSKIVITPTIENQIEKMRFEINSTPLSQRKLISQYSPDSSSSWCPRCMPDVSVADVVFQTLPPDQDELTRLWKDIYLDRGDRESAYQSDSLMIDDFHDSLLNSPLVAKILYQARLNHNCEHKHEISQST